MPATRRAVTVGWPAEVGVAWAWRCRAIATGSLTSPSVSRTTAPIIEVNAGALDVVGIGNALVDVLSHGTDGLLAELELVTG